MSNRLPAPDRVQAEIESIIATLQKVPPDYRHAFGYGHDKRYIEQGIDTQGARASKGSHSDPTAGIALGQMDTRHSLRLVADLLIGDDSIKGRTRAMFSRLQGIFDTPDDFAAPLRSLETGQAVDSTERKLAMKHQAAREMEADMARIESRRRTLAKETNDLERLRDAEIKLEEKAWARKRFLA